MLVPQIVRASTHQDGGNLFISKVFTIGLVVLAAITVLLFVVSPLIVTVLLREAHDPVQTELAVRLGYWCAPQIFFYGAFALIGETMNARRVFGPYTWAPVVNNVVSIAGFLLIGALFQGDLTESSSWTPGMSAMLGIIATLSVALQAAALALFWRKTGIRVRLDFRWRGGGLGELGRAGTWTFVMALAAMLAGFYQTSVTLAASGDASSVTVLNNAWLLFMLPYALIVFSIGTQYFTRIAEGAAAGDHRRVQRDVSQSIRTLGFFVIGAAAAVAAASWLARAGALPVEYLAAAVALGQSISFIVQTVIATTLLRRRLGRIGARTWARSLALFLASALPAGACGVGLYLLWDGSHGWMSSSVIAGGCGAAGIGATVLLVYVAILLVFGAEHARALVSVLMKRRS
ncbi:hypothetical protein GCM10010922_08120 [Microbacterium sorbitolivorans]|uniref:murein biosynthesis integral membrane protein MurJ n=1 Tax=Microbacterium sorbitolivorans TaxID=1867410 RepID=UPI0019CB6815|nr:lipid II flippase MurJ [Microbacterium sorbitolivorans]GGF35336.1 hypothetical protein GCM10010922_08120 [Microbacterium sorbitolivorans]